MSFQVSADAYGQFMGRYSEPLAARFADLAASAGQANAGPVRRALDVGCGPGALTAELVNRFGPAAVCAVDPSEPFVQAARARFPAVDVRPSSAEALPFDDGVFDLTLAQLVVHFMADPVVGLTEMARVTRPGGLVGACVWDYAGERGPLSVFWQAVRDLDAAAADESGLAGAREGHLVELFARAGLTGARQEVLTVRVAYASVAEWWQPYTLGVGPDGAYVAGLEPDRRAALLRRCAELLPDRPFEVAASAWTALAQTA